MEAAVFELLCTMQWPVACLDSIAHTSLIVCFYERRYIRHPGYLGFLMWCIGTQLLLVNPVSCITFAVVVRGLTVLSVHTPMNLTISLIPMHIQLRNCIAAS